MATESETKKMIFTPQGPIMVTCRKDKSGRLIPINAWEVRQDLIKVQFYWLYWSLHEILSWLNFIIFLKFYVSPQQISFSFSNCNDTVENVRIWEGLYFLRESIKANRGAVNVCIKIYIFREIENDYQIFGTKMQLNILNENYQDKYRHKSNTGWILLMDEQIFHLESDRDKFQLNCKQISNAILNRIELDYKQAYLDNGV